MTKKNWLKKSADMFVPKPVGKMLNVYVVGNSRSVFYIQRWSLMHFLSGLVVGILFPQVDYVCALLLHTLWELWQILVGSTPLTTRGAVDILLDTCFFMAGFAVAQ